MIPLLDALSGSAAAIDSVNTIVNDDGRLTGYNTDYAAVVELVADIAPRHRSCCADRGYGQGGGGGPA